VRRKSLNPVPASVANDEDSRVSSSVTRRCSSPFRTELEAFKTSVNHQAISGDLARHARMEGTPPPSRALTLVEARQVISVMVKAWMDWLHAGRPPIP
jgi:hypothetical protein